MDWLITLLSVLTKEEELDVHKLVKTLFQVRNEDEVYTWLRLTCDIILDEEITGFLEKDLGERRFYEALLVDPTCMCCGKDLQATDIGDATAYRIGGNSEQGFELLCDVHAAEIA